jgi:hypothetical protein
MKSLWPAWFFAVVRLHPPYGLAILAVIVGAGIWTTSVSPSELDSGLGMLLCIQMFLASSGFLVRARRGHFDPLLTGARDRTRALVWHWLVSIAPGVAGWICLAGAGYSMGSPAAASAFAGGRAVALFIVSSLGWAVGFALARGAAGVMWMAALVGLLVRHVDLLGSAETLADSSSIVLRHAAILMICPFLLIGNRLAVAPSAVWAAGCLSAVLLLSVWRFFGDLDIYLVDRA